MVNAKKEVLLSQGVSPVTDIIVDRHLSREELALHCRRRSRGVQKTTDLLEDMLKVLMGSAGNHSLGVPLFDRERMERVWQVQKKQIKCLQDPQM